MLGAKLMKNSASTFMAWAIFGGGGEFVGMMAKSLAATDKKHGHVGDLGQNRGVMAGAADQVRATALHGGDNVGQSSGEDWRAWRGGSDERELDARFQAAFFSQRFQLRENVFYLETDAHAVVGVADIDSELDPAEN